MIWNEEKGEEKKKRNFVLLGEDETEAGRIHLRLLCGKHGVIPLSAYLPVPDSDPSLPL